MIKGITKRWLHTTLLLTTSILFIVFLISFILIVGYYDSYVSRLLSGYANESVYSYFMPYINGNDDVFDQKAKEFVDGFADKSIMEVQVINRYGAVSVSSIGFEVADVLSEMPDVSLAIQSQTGISRWKGFNKNGEHIMSVAMLLPTDNGDFTGSVRFITSLKYVDMQMLFVMLVMLVVFLLATAFITVSGLFFIRTIVSPVRSINETAKKFASGDYNVRIDRSGSNSDEMAELVDTINNMMTDVSATDKMKNDFISTVSHELRTPLTAIKGWGEMLKELDGEDRELSRRGTEVIINESERLSTLVEDLLDFSRIQSGRMILRLEKIDVLAELDEAIFVFKERSKREGVELTYSVPDIPAPMEADPNRIKQVFVNILDNAFKYSEPGGKVNVDAVCAEGSLTINFSDNGCGIAPEDIINVKKKFYKANLQARGSGIGLAVVDEIIKLHNGVFEISSELNKGTTVTIVLPINRIPIEPPVAIAQVNENNIIE